MGKFEEVYSINVNDKTEKKGQLTYLSWAFAWAEFKKVYPDATYKIDQFGGLFCTGNEKIGYMCRTEVTAGEQTYEMWLPVMDMRNNTVLQPKMTEINKTIMRCLTKNLAMFGLGLYIYAGEDLPKDEGGEDNKVKPIATAQNKGVQGRKTDAISVACKSLGVGADVYWDKDSTKYDGKAEVTHKQSTTSQPPVEQKKNVEAKGKLYCDDCGLEISVAEKNWSEKKYKKCLCRKCQREY